MATRKAPVLVIVPFVEFLTKVLKQSISRTWRVLLLVSVDGYDPKQFTGPDREIARVLLALWRKFRGACASSSSGG